MNFVPKGPIESALAETLNSVGEPAWVVDADRGAIIGANGRGGTVWGIPTISPVLDSVVPALRALRSRLAQGSFLETTTSTIEPLKFWTAGGLRTLACEVRTLDDSVGPGLLLVVADIAARLPAARRDVRRREMPLAATIERSRAAPSARAEPPERIRQAAPAPTTPTPSAPLNDMETLREIARRIRQGSARITAGVDAPANEDAAPPPAATAPAAPVRPDTPGDRSAALDEQHAHLAHEIRTPLAAIVSLAEVITEERLGPWPNDRYRSYVRDILASARHGLEVVDGILRDAPNDPGAAPVLAEIDLNAEVEAIATSLQPLAEKSGARIEAALGGGLPPVVADRRNVRQMLINLVSNGIKHGGSSVRIKITTGYELNGDVWAEVEDNGPGLPPAERPGGVTQRKAGLGLPLTRSLAAANNARLDLKSRQGRGVRARIVFTGARASR